MNDLKITELQVVLEGKKTTAQQIVDLMEEKPELVVLKAALVAAENEVTAVTLQINQLVNDDLVNSARSKLKQTAQALASGYDGAFFGKQIIINFDDAGNYNIALDKKAVKKSGGSGGNRGSKNISFAIGETKHNGFTSWSMAAAYLKEKGLVEFNPDTSLNHRMTLERLEKTNVIQNVISK